MIKFFKKRLSLTITLVLFVFFVMVATFIILAITVLLLQYAGVITLPSHSEFGTDRSGTPFISLTMLVILCVFLGTALSVFFGKKALNPIRKVITATHRVADGDFSVKVNLKGIGELEELSQSFNKMTQELSSLETLRSDFINNFSHEFKTPIVSIRGFAKLLQDNNITEDEKCEYLNIIISESERLAQLSTNVLNLSKFENVEIVSDKACFRLDEQIRRSVVLLEPKWSAVDIAFNIDLDEISFNGNEDLMQHIWMNLIDNAIKFSYPGGCINIYLKKDEKTARFIIEDEGCGIDKKAIPYIFDKFYQCDTSHSRSGNGLGLAMVKRILKLCGGSIKVKSELGEGSIFTILLPLV